MARPLVATYSIAACDPDAKQWGVATQSKFLAVGSVVPWAQPGVGAIATQANVNVGYGPQGIDLLRQGLTAQQVLQKLLADDKFPGKDGRQVAIVDAHGNVATYTGPNAPQWAGDRQGKTWSAQGNILVGPQVPEAMGRAFESAQGELAERLYAALKAGDDAGGDSRGHQSASILVVRKGGGRNLNNDRYVYVNVDDNPRPFEELRRLLDLNLAYLYEDASDRLAQKHDLAGALAAARTAERYGPTLPDAVETLAFLEYLAGDKASALSDFERAKKLDPHFEKSFHDALDGDPELRPLKEDRAFLGKLFPRR